MSNLAAQDNAILFQIVDDHIALITLNRPAARNAINVAMAQEMARLVAQVENDPSLRVAVLASSHERVFCAGADLADLAAGRGPQLVTNDGFAGLAFAHRNKPWIAAVRGAALAGGCELAIACDMIVASEDARFGVPEVKRGLLAGGGGVFRLPRLIPRNVAFEMVATGDPISAARAEALGLVNRVVPPESVLDESLELARAIVANAPNAVRESLAIARAAADKDEAALRGLSDQASERIMRSADALEGARAFLEKRQPVWTGL